MLCPYVSMEAPAPGEIPLAVVEWWLKRFLPRECKRCVLLLAGVPTTLASSLMRQLNCSPSVIMVAPKGADLDNIKAEWTKDMKDRVPVSIDVMSECADACGRGLPLWVVMESADTSEIRVMEADAILQARMDEALKDPLDTSAEPITATPPDPTPTKQSRKRRSASRSPSPPKKTPKKHRKAEKKKKSKPLEESSSDLTSEEEDTPVTRATSSKTPVKKAAEKPSTPRKGKAASAMQQRLGQAYKDSKDKKSVK